jgi:hypothetical protein
MTLSAHKAGIEEKKRKPKEVQSFSLNLERNKWRRERDSNPLFNS